MPVVSALTIQKIAVTSGTFTKVLRSICIPSSFRSPHAKGKACVR
jgi:hypothetical protein